MSDPHERSTKRSPRGVELRFYGDELDEVVAQNGAHFHLEQMDHGHWWMQIGDVHVNLHTKTRSKHITADYWIDT